MPVQTQRTLPGNHEQDPAVVIAAAMLCTLNFWWGPTPTTFTNLHEANARAVPALWALMKPWFSIPPARH